MVEADTLELLTADLERLPATHRRQVLAALTPVERNRLERLLEPAAAEVESHPPAIFEACFSPWLAARLKEAEAGKGAMTAAVRQQLLRAAHEAIAEAPAAVHPVAGSRSLLQILLTALGPRKAAA
jgi:hypothetical protein